MKMSAKCITMNAHENILLSECLLRIRSLAKMKINIFSLTKSHIYKEVNICPVALIYVDFASYLIDYVWQ